MSASSLDDASTTDADAASALLLKQADAWPSSC